MKPAEWTILAILLLAIVALMLPAVQQPHGPGPRHTAKSNLKQLGLAVWYFHEETGHLPPGTLRDAEDRAVHGWPTAILPHLEQQGLYEQIDLQLPWDHPANAAVFRTRLRVLEHPFVSETHDPHGFALTHFAANVHVISAHDPMRFEDITDGLDQTFLAGSVNGRFVAWGDPLNFREPALGINADPRGFGAPPSDDDGTPMLMADGSVHRFADDTDRAVLRALATPAGGEVELQRRGLESRNEP